MAQNALESDVFSFVLLSVPLNTFEKTLSFYEGKIICKVKVAAQVLY
jgi:hypothetical protein